MNTQHAIETINFWLINSRDPILYHRDIINDIPVKTNEIIDIIGPRRCGKSSILKLIIKKLKLKDNYLFLNFEDPFFIENNTPRDIEDLINIFIEHFNPNLKYLFFDEIQQINDWERIIRKYRDSNKFKIFVTSSSSKLLSSELSTLLTGRHLTQKVFPLSFTEYLNFNNVHVKSRKALALKMPTIKKFLNKFLNAGGFPEAVLTNNPELLKTYFFDILYKDVVMRYDIRQKNVLEKIALFMISNSAKTYSINSLKKTFNISFELASSYLSYLKEAFLIFEIQQFSFSLKAQNKALGKIYSVDTGLASAVSFKFSDEKGRMLENVIFLELKKTSSQKLFYYKTKSNYEVDFLTFINEKPDLLIQVAYSIDDPKTRHREIRALKAAMKELNLKKSYIITMESEEECLQIDGCEIEIIPASLWILNRSF